MQRRHRLVREHRHALHLHVRKWQQQPQHERQLLLPPHPQTRQRPQGHVLANGQRGQARASTRSRRAGPQRASAGMRISARGFQMGSHQRRPPRRTCEAPRALRRALPRALPLTATARRTRTRTITASSPIARTRAAAASRQRLMLATALRRWSLRAQCRWTRRTRRSPF